MSVESTQWTTHPSGLDVAVARELVDALRGHLRVQVSLSTAGLRCQPLLSWSQYAMPCVITVAWLGFDTYVTELQVSLEHPKRRCRRRTHDSGASDGEALGGALVRLELLDNSRRGESARAERAQHVEAEHCCWSGLAEATSSKTDFGTTPEKSETGGWSRPRGVVLPRWPLSRPDRLFSKRALSKIHTFLERCCSEGQEMLYALACTTTDMNGACDTTVRSPDPTRRLLLLLLGLLGGGLGGSLLLGLLGVTSTHHAEQRSLHGSQLALLVLLDQAAMSVYTHTCFRSPKELLPMLVVVLLLLFVGTLGLLALDLQVSHGLLGTGLASSEQGASPAASLGGVRSLPLGNGSRLLLSLFLGVFAGNVLARVVLEDGADVLGSKDGDGCRSVIGSITQKTHTQGRGSSRSGPCRRPFRPSGA